MAPAPVPAPRAPEPVPVPAPATPAPATPAVPATKEPGRGRRLLLVLALLAAVVVALVAWRALDDDEPDPGTGGTAPATTTLDVEVGDCVVLPGGGGPEGDTQLTGVTVVPCTQPHGAEVFGRAVMKDPAYPGDAFVRGFADRACDRRFRPYVGKAFDDSVLGVSWIHPTRASWAEGSRNVTCLVYEPEGGQTTGSLRNSGR